MRLANNTATTWVLTAVVGLVYAWAGQGGIAMMQRLTPGFAPAPVRAARSLEPAFTAQFIRRNTGSMEHVASLCELPDGRLVATWYAGSHEAATDVVILLATKPAELASGWSTPRVVVNPTSAAAELRRPVGKVGNAVVFAAADGRLFLVFVTMPFGGWATSALNLKTSNDGGATLTPARTLVLSPLFNLGTLVKNKPLPLASGGFLLPISHELLERFADLLWLPADVRGAIDLRTTRLRGGPRFFQPGLAALDGARGVAVLRSSRAGGNVGVATTLDGGASWGEMRSSTLPNPDSGLDVVALANGRVLLAFNDERFGRSNLSLAVSSDAGSTWRRVAVLEDEPGAEFSYPFLLRSRDGRIHLVYTWNRRGLKHVTFSEAWVEAKERQAR
ncbi:MAG: exo-alpha-sialidase [Thermoanaerobaculales bacterium]